jgi:hypothetical protein
MPLFGDGRQGIEGPNFAPCRAINHPSSLGLGFSISVSPQDIQNGNANPSNRQKQSVISFSSQSEMRDPPYRPSFAC